MRKEISVYSLTKDGVDAPSPLTVSYVPQGEAATGLAAPLTGAVLALLALLYGMWLIVLNLTGPSWLAELLRGEAFPLLGLF